MIHRKWYSLTLSCLLASLLLVGCLGFVDTTTDDDDDTSDNGTGTPSSSDTVFCDFSESDIDSEYNNDFNDDGLESTFEWSCSDTNRTLDANGIPNHDVGEFPSTANPNTISEQSVLASITLTPVESSTTTPLGGSAGVTGYMLNGVTIDAEPTGSCGNNANEASDCSLVDSTSSWSIETLGQTVFDFGVDDNNAHVNPDGTYHYHGIPADMLESLDGDSGTTMTLVGWASDGFPIYARFGFITADDSSSGIKIIASSYQTIDEDDVPSTRPSTDVFPLGTFEQDWEYVEDSGDLDECNGRDGVTPEFPDGIYHYFATNSYPFLQRCVNGEI
jgi:hypothetical protein